MLKNIVCALGALFCLALPAVPLRVSPGVVTTLPSCAGTLTVQRNGQQINLAFEHVEHCSNFDIVSRNFGILDVNYNRKKLVEETGRHAKPYAMGGSFTIPKAYIERGLNDIRLEVRSNSGRHSDSIELVFVESSTSLAGSCLRNAAEFSAAYAFAESMNGLSKGRSEAERFANNYVQHHACGTIGEFQARFHALYDYANNLNFLSKNFSESREYAASLAESIPVAKANEWKALFPHVYDLFNSMKYLSMSFSESRAKTEAWIVRGDCGTAKEVASLKGQFTRHYEFATSFNGLNLGFTRARAYAVGQVSHLTPCADLLH